MNFNYLPQITEKELAVSEVEKAKCKEWFFEQVLSAGENGNIPAYDFCYGTEKLSENLGDWSFCHDSGSPENNGIRYKINAVNKINQLSLVIDAVLYEEYAVCEWTVFLTNNSSMQSERISHFSALNKSFSAPNGELLYSSGNDDTPKDFKPHSMTVEEFPKHGKRFTGVDGRSSERYLPFFNMHTDDISLVCAVGWSGQWYSRFLKEADDKVSIEIRQQFLNAKLFPNEEIRTPSVSLCFYHGAAIKGFNSLRHWISDCVYLKEIKQFVFVEPDLCGAPYDESISYPDDIRSNVEILKKHGISDYDYIWIDAIWFPRIEDWSQGTGNWTVDETFYPGGLRKISDYLKLNGKKLLLWYDPEVVYKKTDLWNFGKTQEKYMIDIGKSRAVWNYADEDAFKYICKLIDASIKANGVSFYRQDFTIAPLEFWQYADKNFYGKRTGICENHYISNMYRFLDYLREKNPSLIIDNCASGGKRLDIEMCRRSVPLWRSDYNCSDRADLDEATQCQTLGLSLWLPLSCSCNDYAKTRYDFRSQITPILHIGPLLKEENPESFKLMRDFQKLKNCMTGNFFPLTDFSSSTRDMLAVQFCSPDNQCGFAVIYSRKNVKQGITYIKLNGLDSDTCYKIFDFDKPEACEDKSGNELMTTGIKLNVENTPDAKIFVYQKK